MAASFLGSLNPKLSVGPAGPRIELSRGSDVPQTIIDALSGLDRLAGEVETHACLILDEFQQLAALRDARPVEAAIRHAVERARHVTFVFSGSHRHLLEQLFTDRSRPLYLLCEPMTLERIPGPEYGRHLSQWSRRTWGATVAPAAIDEVLRRTQRHPFYVNRICALLWGRPAPPSEADVAGAWREIVEGLGNWLAAELERLSPTQRAVLTELALAPANALTGRRFVARTRLAKSSLAQAAGTLERAAQIERDVNGVYSVLDPALAQYLRADPVRVPVP